MGKLYLVLSLMFVLSTTLADAKTLGSFKKYNQVTDKEVLIESTKGYSILVSAYSNNAIGFQLVGDKEPISLHSPLSISTEKALTGSIYVEELDELMQITTTEDNGLVIKIEKNPLSFTYIDKSSKNVFLQDHFGANVSDEFTVINFEVDSDENFKLISATNLQKRSANSINGNILDKNMIEVMSKSTKNICIDSSNGYALIFDKNSTSKIDLSKDDKLVISNKNSNNTNFSFILVYGSEKPELIEKYASNIVSESNKLTLK